MKFAVVEYSSKSGKVWQHTDAKPNYLADPDKEIDPTSFGCYVSALHGQHIPLKGFMLGNVVPTNKVVVSGRRLFRKLFKHWPQNYDLSYFQQFDVLMVVHQISDGHEMTLFTKKLWQVSPRPLIIGVPTQPFGLWKDYYAKRPAEYTDFQQYLHACDVFLTVVESTKNDWQAMTDTPVTYLAQPYPVEYALKYWQGVEAKKPIILVAGVTDRPNIALGQKVAKQLQEKFPNYIIHVTDTPGHNQDLSALGGAKYEVQPFLPWQQQLAYLSKVHLVINTDYTQTRGRVQVDCAAVGTISIGADSDGQADLFPDFLATSQTSAEELISQATRLLQDKSLYAATAATAKEKLSKYNYAASKQRVEQLVKQYPKRAS